MQLNITPAKQVRIVAALKGLFPRPTVRDPDWPGDPMLAPFVPQYSDNVWAKICVMNFIKKSVQTWESDEGARAARRMVDYDDDLVT